jgi:hypothetical protein
VGASLDLGFFEISGVALCRQSARWFFVGLIRSSRDVSGRGGIHGNGVRRSCVTLAHDIYLKGPYRLNTQSSRGHL